MNRLKGWQRISVVLMVMWTLLVGVIGDKGTTEVDHSIDHSQNPPYAKMSSAVRERMTTPPWEGEDCDGPIGFGAVYEEVKNLPGLSTPVRLCFAIKGISGETRQEIDAVIGRMTTDYFSTRLSRTEVERIKTEYARAYGEQLRDLRKGHYQRIALTWVIPGAALYALAWGTGWIWSRRRLLPVRPARLRRSEN